MAEQVEAVAGASVDASLRELLETLEDLRAALHALQAARQRTTPPATELLSPLVKVVEGVGAGRPARPPACPEEFRAQWEEYLGGQRKGIEARAVRYLCWEPDIATDPRFQSYLDRIGADLRPRALQGLVHSCHARWEESLFRSKVATRIRTRVDSYAGPNRVAQRWRANADLVLGAEGPALLGRQLLDQRTKVQDYCGSFAVDAQSAYVIAGVGAAVAAWWATGLRDDATMRYGIDELLFWSGWPLDQFYRVMAATLLSREADAPAVMGALKTRILRDSRLGDPRLPAASTNWRGVDEKARRKVIQWLSSDDIRFFFEHVLRTGEDPHGRKRFWLRYVDKVQMSRPLLCADDRARLRALRLKDQPSNFGLVDAPTSAFMLVFERLLIIEFSKVGNACFVYEPARVRDILESFWTTNAFHLSTLKRPHHDADRIVHRAGWEWSMDRLLGRYGIRPG
ncbi:EH signature domain-containing protein [Candidatus Binatia bacterium]|nr:EH signature domain-containing protein [Candidatus Binatia bacterium]